MNNIPKLTLLTLLLLAMTTSMSNVAIVTMLPHLKDYFKDISNIEFYSRLMLTLPSLVIAVGTQRIWPARAFTLGHLTHNDLASVRIAKRATKSL